MCFYIVLDSLAASCIGWPTSRFYCLSWLTLQGWCKANAEPSSLELYWAAAFTRTRNFLFASTKVQHFSCASKFYPSIWGDSTNLTNWCFQHRRCSCSAKLMQAWLCTRLIASFERTVIHDARIRNFRPSKITFRRWRSRLRASFYSHNRHIVTM